MPLPDVVASASLFRPASFRFLLFQTLEDLCSIQLPADWLRHEEGSLRARGFLAKTLGGDGAPPQPAERKGKTEAPCHEALRTHSSLEKECSVGSHEESVGHVGSRPDVSPDVAFAGEQKVDADSPATNLALKRAPQKSWGDEVGSCYVQTFRGLTSDAEGRQAVRLLLEAQGRRHFLWEKVKGLLRLSPAARLFEFLYCCDGRRLPTPGAARLSLLRTDTARADASATHSRT